VPFRLTTNARVPRYARARLSSLSIAGCLKLFFHTVACVIVALGAALAFKHCSSPLERGGRGGRREAETHLFSSHASRVWNLAEHVRVQRPPRVHTNQPILSPSWVSAPRERAGSTRERRRRRGAKKAFKKHKENGYERCPRLHPPAPEASLVALVASSGVVTWRAVSIAALEATSTPPW